MTRRRSGCAAGAWLLVLLGGAVAAEAAVVVVQPACCGVTAGAAIQAAHDALPASGGTLDARAFEGAQVIAGLTLSKPVTLLLGHATFRIDGAIKVTAADSVKLLGSGGDRTVLVRGPNLHGAASYLVKLDRITSAEVAGLRLDNAGAPGGTEPDNKEPEGNFEGAGDNPMLGLRNGSRRVHVHDNVFFNTGSARAIYLDWGEYESEDLVIERNRFESTTAAVNGIAIYLASLGRNLRVSDNSFWRAGAIFLSPGYKQLGEHRIEVCGNRFQDVDATNISIRSSALQKVETILVCRNQFENAGLTKGKGFIAVGESMDAPASAARILIIGNIGRAWGHQHDSSIGIAVGGVRSNSTIEQLVIADNILDGRLTSGANVPGQGYGIYVKQKATDFAIHGNLIRNTGRSGIAVEDGVSGELHDNIILAPVQWDGATKPEPAGMGGIYLINGCEHLRVHHNRITNVGTAAAPSHGILLTEYPTSPPSRAMDAIIVEDNVILDDRKPALTSSGIMSDAKLSSFQLANNVVSPSITTPTAPAGLADYLHVAPAAGRLLLSPAQDKATFLFMNAGLSVAQWSALSLQDRGTTSWLVGKDASNRYVVQSETDGGKQRLLMDPRGSTVLDHGSSPGSVVAVKDLRVDGGVSSLGSGLKHARFDANLGPGRFPIEVVWATAFADTSYTVTCTVTDTGTGTQGLSVHHVSELSATGVKVVLENDAAVARVGKLHCQAIHD